MIEPIRRVIDSAIPTQPSQDPPDYANDLNEDVRRVINAEDLGKFARPYPTDESLENPLLGLNSQEYLAFKRYQQEHKLPLRFKTASAASENALYHPREPPSVDPTLRTSYQDYGKFLPNVHTQPYSYHGLNTKFSQKKFGQGMYKNNSFNL